MDLKSFAAGRNSASESGGGATNYADLTNKPQIAGVTLSGNHAVSDFLTDITDAQIERAISDAWDAVFE